MICVAASCTTVRSAGGRLPRRGIFCIVGLRRSGSTMGGVPCGQSHCSWGSVLCGWWGQCWNSSLSCSSHILMWPLAGWRAWITSFDVRCLPSSASYRLGILFSSALSWRWKILDYSLRPSTMSFQSLMAMPSALISHGLQTFGECYSVHLTQRARLTLALESRKCHCLFVCWKFIYAIRWFY